MAARVCDWRRCDLPGRLAVLAGEAGGPTEALGVYCLAHGTIKRRAVEQQKRLTVWLHLYGPAQPRRTLLEEQAGRRALHRHGRPLSRGRTGGTGPG